MAVAEMEVREEQGGSPQDAASAASMAMSQELNPWEAQAARFDFAAGKLDLETGIWKVLRQPAREIIVHFPVLMDDGTIEHELCPVVIAVVAGEPLLNPDEVDDAELDEHAVRLP